MGESVLCLTRWDVYRKPKDRGVMKVLSNAIVAERIRYSILLVSAEGVITLGAIITVCAKPSHFLT